MRESGDQRAAVLFVDDEVHNRQLFELQLGDEQRVLLASDGQEALAVLEREDVAVVLTDERMPRMTGIDLLARMVERFPDVGRVIVSAYGDADRLLGAINRGHAHEYILKPWSVDDLRGCVRRALQMAERRRALAERAGVAECIEEDLRRSHDPRQIVGEQGGLGPTVSAARRAAQSESTVLLLGETGTGKELLARFIHESSPRAGRPFVRVGCAALAEGVLESELFGHEKGAFTHAVRTRRGRFELAQHGTIFLDEIGDVSPKLQVSLLRVLQERVVERVGGDQSIPVDVRVIAATHQDLPRRVQQGSFRADLFYRLNVIPIHVPPLRERIADIPALIEHMVQKHGGPRPPPVSREAMEVLARYGWPGNVRELENLVERALVMRTGDELELDDFSLDLGLATRPIDVREQARAVEAEELRELLLSHGGNVTRAARALNIPRTTLLARARKHGLL